MENCFRCGVSEENKPLFNAISGKGIVKICSNCSAMEGFPIIKKPVEKVEETEKQKSVRERLIGMNKKFSSGKEPTLRDLIDEKYKAKNPQVHPDLTENFHWKIQQIRRNRKITREQFAAGIGESDATIRMIEGGILPEDNYKIISKIEKYLGISLRKNEQDSQSIEAKKFVLDNSLIQTSDLEDEPKQLGFDYNSVKKLKIGDLQKMNENKEIIEKERKEKRIPFWKRKKEKKTDDEKEDLESEEK